MKKSLFVVALVVVGLSLPLLIPHVHADEGATVTLYNPLGDETDVRVIIGRVIKGVLSIIGSIAFLMFIYGGVLWLTSGGNSDAVKKGRDVLIWTTLGLAIIFAAYAIVSAVLNAITSGSVV